MNRILAFSRRELMVLVVLFACLLLTFLTLTQAQTINSQRTLIHQLFQDSLELNALKVQNLQKARQHR
ncbi:MAG TPA: hypothetical protein VFU76_17915 [Terriglobales bacterium]|nr:hypothetical protein [Terriglobales bacterium]